MADSNGFLDTLSRVLDRISDGHYVQWLSLGFLPRVLRRFERLRLGTRAHAKPSEYLPSEPDDLH